MKNKTVVIVGAGAAGLIASITAAEHGASVILLEQNNRPGRKICATGNGKCNLTNLNQPKDAYRGSQPDFAYSALKQFSIKNTLTFFENLGLYPVNREGYIYPRSGQAQSVTDILVMKARSLGVKLKTNEKVRQIRRLPTEQKWQVLTEGWHYEGDAVILANGSRASNIAGSDGSGYALAKSLGHRIIEPLPALTALKCSGKGFSAWAGVRIHGRLNLMIETQSRTVPATIARQKEGLYTQEGELQLTDYGISGIPVFQLSRYAVRALAAGQKVTGTLDFLPECSMEELEVLLDNRVKCCPWKSTKEQLIGLFPDKLIRVLTAQNSLLQAIKAFPVTISAGMSFDQAQVCSGGVDTAQIHPGTMESLIQKNLYFAGELLDIDGTCGGYNLQWAWSSGAVAGKYAASNGNEEVI